MHEKRSYFRDGDSRLFTHCWISSVSFIATDVEGDYMMLLKSLEGAKLVKYVSRGTYVTE